MDGELMTEAEGSLFPRALLEGCRVSPLSLPLRGFPSPPKGGEEFDRVVVGVDPPVSEKGDACGIVVAGRRDGKLYVLADLSVEQATPERWARAVAGATSQWRASHVVAEAC